MPMLVGRTHTVADASAFVFEVKTTGEDETFSLPLEATGTYDFNVDWGDGNDDDITAYDDAAVTHTYASADTYEVSITGTISGWRFANGGDKTKIYDISSWGPLNLGNSTQYFYGCSNLTVSATDALDLTGTTNLSHLFNGCTSLTTVGGMDSWDVSNVTNLHQFVSGATSFNQDLNSWDTSSVTDMSYAFYGATSFNGNISSWDVSSVTTFSHTFYNCNAFNQDIGGWNISSANTIDRMFYLADIFNQDIGSWDTSSVTGTQYMFSGDPAFDQDLSGWDISQITDMTDMFVGNGLSQANYDLILVGWEAQVEQPNVTFSAGTTKYTGGGVVADARAALVASGWTITDGGVAQ